MFAGNATLSKLNVRWPDLFDGRHVDGGYSPPCIIPPRETHICVYTFNHCLKIS